MKQRRPCTCGSSWEDPHRLESAFGANAVDVEGKRAREKRGQGC